MPRIRETALLLAAAASGVVWAWQFAREPFLIAPWLALAPLVLMLDRGRPLLVGLAHGWAYWLTAIPWIVPTLETFGHLSAGLSLVLLVLLALYLGSFTALFVVVGRQLLPLGPWLAPVALGALWVVAELLRGWLFGGFPWNLAAYAWIGVAGALPLAAWVGPYGISFLLVYANAGIALGLRARSWRPVAAAVLWPLLLLALAGRLTVEERSVTAGQPVKVLQPNTPIIQEADSPEVLVAYGDLMDLSWEACDTPGLLVWPESAAWPFGYQWHPGLREDVERLAAAGCPVLLNSPMTGAAGGTHNSAVLAGAAGPLGQYDKRHLVPFGEHVPLAGVLPFLQQIARYAGDFVPASGVTLLPWGEDRLGVAICFEITFPGEVADLTRAGATVLVTITNDGWYGDTWAPWQHFRAARFRAAENRRPLVRAALTGVSAFVDNRGRRGPWLDVHDKGILRAGIRGGRELTPYARWPWAVPMVAWVVTIVALVAAGRKTRSA